MLAFRCHSLLPFSMIICHIFSVCFIFPYLSFFQDLLKIEKRLFEFSDYEAFDQYHQHGLLKFDKELDWLLKDEYTEMPIRFRPT